VLRARWWASCARQARRHLQRLTRRADCTATHLEAAVDDALDLFDVLMATRLISTARRASTAERLAAMPRLERASVTLARRGRC
jgi:hypothetical protein